MPTREEILQIFDLPQDALDMINDGDLFNTWFNRSDAAYCRGIIPLEQFKDKYQAEEVGNFVYYRDAGVVFNTLQPARHETFMSGLYNLHKLKQGFRETSVAFASNPHLGRMFCDSYDGQDLYLKEGMGVYQSSCVKDCYRHKDFQFNAAEYDAFGFLNPNILTY